MSKELIEKLRAFAPYASPNAADLMHEAADALEAKAAPMGEREAYEAWKFSMNLMEENQQLKAELARLRAGQEPVAYQCREIGEGDWADCDKKWFDYCERSPLHDTRKLYTTPQPSAVPDGCMIVPIQPTDEMRKRAQDYLAAEGMIVSDWLVHTAYTEMLAAAPSAPATAQGDEYRLRAKLGEVSRIAGNALSSIGGIRQGQNVTSDELWRACEYLDAAIAAARQEGGKV